VLLMFGRNFDRSSLLEFFWLYKLYRQQRVILSLLYDRFLPLHPTSMRMTWPKAAKRECVGGLFGIQLISGLLCLGRKEL
jgi:hypothetical protein